MTLDMVHVLAVCHFPESTSLSISITFLLIEMTNFFEVKA